MDKIELIKKAKDAYYNSGNPIMSDFEYDKLVAEVGYESVGAPVLDSLNKIDISDKPMLSLNKCHSVEEIKDFAKGQNLIASIKCDGLSVRIIYENGKLISANTRGDGQIGQDITEHIKQFTNVPLVIDTKERLIVDGEAIIFQADFDEINKNGEFKNPRNLAAGTLASLDTSLCKDRRLSFIAWDVIEGGKTNSYSSNLSNLLSYGFTIVDYLIPSDTDFDIINNNILKIAKKKGIPCDGVVWKYDDITFDTTKTSHHFNNGIAWKPPVEEYDTTLLDIEWTMGRTGVLTPVAIFEPVNADGSIIERASLHNISVMFETMNGGAFVGEHIKVAKMNMIIPQIVWAENSSHKDCKLIPILDKCPICNEKTEIKESESGTKNLICTNPQCEGKFINQLDHFCGKKGLDIRGLSKMTLEKLVDWGWVGNIKEIFSLSNFRDEWIKKPGFGVKSVDNILAAIETSRSTTLDKFIAALGIPLIGTTAAKAISKKENGNVFNFFEDINTDFDFSTLDNFGCEMNKAIHSFDYSIAKELCYNAIIEIEEIKEEEKSNGLKGLVFVITGKLSRKRDDIKADIEAKGGKVSSSISGKTNYLICNQPENTSKYKSAIEKNIPIITENQLNSLIELDGGIK